MELTTLLQESKKINYGFEIVVSNGIIGSNDILKAIFGGGGVVYPDKEDLKAHKKANG